MGSELRRSILNDVTAIASSVPPAWRLPIWSKNWVKEKNDKVFHTVCFPCPELRCPSQQSPAFAAAAELRSTKNRW